MTVFTEFCCRSGGSNLNAGTRTGSATEPGVSADLTYASGSWVASTGVFTVASGNPVTDGVAVGDFASVYANGSTVTGFVGQITARTTTTITVDLGVKMGTAPVDGTSTRTLKVGGAWKGINGADGFPLNLIRQALANSGYPANRPRVNMKNDAVYSITANIQTVNAQDGVVVVQGYTTTYGDGGRAVIDGGTTGASYTLLTMWGTPDWHFEDLQFQNNGATGSADGIIAGNSHGGYEGNYFRHVVITAMRGSGMIMTGSAQNLMVECEIYGCNQSNTANKAGYDGQSGGYLLRNFIHHNVGSNTIGVRHGGGGSVIDNVISNNGAAGLVLTSNTTAYFISNNVFYGNGGDGIGVPAGGGTWAVYIENNIFTKNGGWGINLNSGGIIHGFIMKSGYGAGSEANALGTINLVTGTSLIVSDLTTPIPSNVSPFVDAPHGDFRTNIASVKGVGRGAFLQTDSAHYTTPNTVSYPDIGAAQQLDVGGGGGGYPASRLQIGH